jgi:hypothetical protein
MSNLNEASMLKEIIRLRAQLYSTYKRDKHISAAVLGVSLELDQQINAYMQAIK